MKASELKKMIERLQQQGYDDFGFMVELRDHKGIAKSYKITGALTVWQIAKENRFYLELLIGDEVKG